MGRDFDLENDMLDLLAEHGYIDEGRKDYVKSVEIRLERDSVGTVNVDYHAVTSKEQECTCEGPNEACSACPEDR